MSHTCKAALVRCMDFRLEPGLYEYLREAQLLHDTDIISIAGAAKNIADDPQGFVMTQIGLSVELHGIHEVHLMHHSDCGAYGGSRKHASFEEEKAMHLGEMQKAKETILAAHPSLIVRLFLAVVENNRLARVETL
jgi:carbonic anhydrase